VVYEKESIKMKKIVLLLCAALLVSSLLVGCGNDGNTDNPGNNNSQQTGNMKVSMQMVLRLHIREQILSQMLKWNQS
jgi:hypothetical protein